MSEFKIDLLRRSLEAMKGTDPARQYMGPFVVGVYRSDVLDDQVEQFRESMAVNVADGRQRSIYAVAAAMERDTAVGEKSWLVATTGNGPRGRATAVAIAALLQTAPALLDLAEAVRELRDCGGGHVETTVHLANVLRAYAKLEG